MKKLIVLTITILLNLTASGQNDTTIIDTVDIKYCSTYLDYLQDNWIELDLPIVKTKSHNNNLDEDVVMFCIANESNKTSRKLQKEMLFVKYENTLYANIQTMRMEGTSIGQGFVPVYVFDYAGDNFLFIAPPISQAVYIPMPVNSGFFGGFIGGAITGALIGLSMNHQDSDICYIYNPLDCSIKVLNNTEILKLLKNNGSTDLLAEYKSKTKKERTLANNVIPILLKLGFLKTAPIYNRNNEK